MFSIVDITEANLADIPESCRACIYWELPEDFVKAKEQKDESKRRLEFERKKHAWFINTMKEFGTCGKIVYFRDRSVAYAQFAPSELLPNTAHYKSHPVGKSKEGSLPIMSLRGGQRIERKRTGKEATQDNHQRPQETRVQSC